MGRCRQWIVLHFVAPLGALKEPQIRPHRFGVAVAALQQMVQRWESQPSSVPPHSHLPLTPVSRSITCWGSQKNKKKARPLLSSPSRLLVAIPLFPGPCKHGKPPPPLPSSPLKSRRAPLHLLRVTRTSCATWLIVGYAV